MKGSRAGYYCHPDWTRELEARGLLWLEAWRDLPAEAVDVPNERYGGISRVGRVAARDPQGRETNLFIKYQHNQRRRTLRHPIKGEPGFAIEFRRLEECRDLGIRVPEVVFFATHRSESGHEAVLVLSELRGFRSLEEWLADPSMPRDSALPGQLAAAVAGLHRAGRVHRNLYPKHIFVETTPAPDTGRRVAFIDMEKCRSHGGLRSQVMRDLETLHRRTHGAGEYASLRFLVEYVRLAWSRDDPRRWARRIQRATGARLRRRQEEI